MFSGSYLELENGDHLLWNGSRIQLRCGGVKDPNYRYPVLSNQDSFNPLSAVVATGHDYEFTEKDLERIANSWKYLVISKKNSRRF
jgi:hypothetical protein